MVCGVNGSYGLNTAQKVESTITNTAAQTAVTLNQNLASGNSLYALKITSANADAATVDITSTASTSNAFDSVVYLHNAAGSSTPLLRIDVTGTGPGIRIVPAAGKGPALQIEGLATGDIAAAAEGSIAYDTTLHKLKVRGAVGWETITSV